MLFLCSHDVIMMNVINKPRVYQSIVPVLPSVMPLIPANHLPS